MSRWSRITGMLVTFLAAVAVSAFAALFAFGFRRSIRYLLEYFGGDHRSTAVSQSTSPLLVFAIVTGGLLLASWLGRLASSWRHQRLGLLSIAEATLGVGDGPSLSGTLVRTSGTWVAMASLASLGREATILEVGGSFGSWLSRKINRPPADLAVTGVAAAFAAVYHAPIGGFLYVREHVVNQPKLRIAGSALAGGVLGWAISMRFLGGGPVFERGFAPLGVDSFVHAAVGLVPALVATRLFFTVRQRILPAQLPMAATVHTWVRSALFAALGGLTIALVPLASGNGMDAISKGVTGATIGLGLALCFGKIVATTASLAAGAPGGAFSPSMAVAAGAALLAFEALDKLGIPLSGSHWDGMLAAMSVGIAVGIQAPLVGIVVVAELAGDVRLVPVCALSVLGARAIQLAVDKIGVARSAGLLVPDEPLDA
ncbi:MAG: chloride channel protein [Actinomycetota bacterium]